jgi:hypothetical protein
MVFTRGTGSPEATRLGSRMGAVHSLKKARGMSPVWIATHLTTRSSTLISLVKMLWNSMSFLPLPVGGSCSLGGWARRQQWAGRCATSAPLTGRARSPRPARP